MIPTVIYKSPANSDFMETAGIEPALCSRRAPTEPTTPRRTIRGVTHKRGRRMPETEPTTVTVETPPQPQPEQPDERREPQPEPNEPPRRRDHDDDEKDDDGE